VSRKIFFSLDLSLIAKMFLTTAICHDMQSVEVRFPMHCLTLRLLMSYIYGAPSKARNVNVVCVWTYVWQR